MISEYNIKIKMLHNDDDDVNVNNDEDIHIHIHGLKIMKERKRYHLESTTTYFFK